MKRLKHANRAFTLIEVIVVIALVGILGVGVISMMVPASSMFQFMSSDVTAKMKANQVMEIVSAQTRFAKDLEIQSNTSKVGEKAAAGFWYLYGMDNKIYMNKGSSEDLFSEDFYEGYGITLTADAIENNLVEIIIEVKSGENVISSLTSSVEVINTAIVAGDKGPVLCFKWGPS